MRPAAPYVCADMTPAEAVDRLNFLLAHLWMVRTYLKHADEVTEPVPATPSPIEVVTSGKHLRQS